MHYLCVQLTYSEKATRLYFNVGVNNFCLCLRAIKEKLSVRQQEKHLCFEGGSPAGEEAGVGAEATPPGGCAAPA